MFFQDHRTYAERAKERRENEGKGKKSSVTRYDRPSLTYDQRATQRRAEEQGRRAAEKTHLEEEEAARKKTLAETPEHLRRPRNVWTDLIAQWQGREYDPSVRAKLKEYRRREKKREKEIDLEMEEKERKHRIETDQKVIDALKHCGLASQFATDDEREHWAVARGLAEGGALEKYWEAARVLTEKAREREQARLNTEADKLGELKKQHDEASARLDAALESARQALAAAGGDAATAEPDAKTEPPAGKTEEPSHA